jgi:hypothetical protein
MQLVTGGRIGINLGCSSSGSTVYHNVVNGASEAGINIDTCEYNPVAGTNPGSNYNSVHHNTVCGGIYPHRLPPAIRPTTTTSITIAPSGLPAPVPATS